MAAGALQAAWVPSSPSGLEQTLDRQVSLEGVSWGIWRLDLPGTCFAVRLPVFPERRQTLAVGRPAQHVRFPNSSALAPAELTPLQTQRSVPLQRHVIQGSDIARYRQHFTDGSRKSIGRVQERRQGRT
jgi:hypothetical protein